MVSLLTGGGGRGRAALEGHHLIWVFPLKPATTFSLSMKSVWYCFATLFTLIYLIKTLFNREESPSNLMVTDAKSKNRQRKGSQQEIRHKIWSKCCQVLYVLNTEMSEMSKKQLRDSWFFFSCKSANPNPGSHCPINMGPTILTVLLLYKYEHGYMVYFNAFFFTYSINYSSFHIYSFLIHWKFQDL